jgi:hypothetical protein
MPFPPDNYGIVGTTKHGSHQPVNLLVLLCALTPTGVRSLIRFSRSHLLGHFPGTEPYWGWTSFNIPGKDGETVHDFKKSFPCRSPIQSHGHWRVGATWHAGGLSRTTTPHRNIFSCNSIYKGTPKGARPSPTCDCSISKL